jgi:dihydrodipicolinate synthase/N-acetylneuraminate lyase
MLKGAIAAAVTPLTEDGRAVDEAAFGPLVRFLVGGGVDGLLAGGTTGEGILLSVDERRLVTERFLAERPDGFLIAVHAGAQSTDDTVAIASHARDAGADAVAVIAPPYFPLDAVELFEHLRAAAAASDAVPFYLYEFIGRAGYPIPLPVIERLREVAPNLAGLKVSDTPWAGVEPYVIDGLDLFVGSEPLVLRGLEVGAVGAVSGLATAFPELVASLVHDRDVIAGERVAMLRERLTMPFISALKVILGARGVPVSPAMRRPLRQLTAAERDTALEVARAVGVDITAGHGVP